MALTVTRLEVDRQDLLDEIINRIDVVPRLQGRVTRSFNHVQVDPIAIELSPAHQDNGFGRRCRCDHGVVGSTQALALGGTHRPVVKVKPQERSDIVFPRKDFLERCGHRPKWDEQRWGGHATLATRRRPPQARRT